MMVQVNSRNGNSAVDISDADKMVCTVALECTRRGSWVYVLVLMKNLYSGSFKDKKSLVEAPRNIVGGV